MHIKNIIFDFGGVFYQIDRQRTIEEFSRLSTKPDFKQTVPIRDLVFKPGFMDYERGNSNSASFRDFLRRELALEATDEQIDQAWNATLIDLFPQSEELVKQFAAKFNIVLLSNTNDIHYKYFYPKTEIFLKHFQTCFFSNHIGAAKPDVAPFTYVLDKTGFIPDETLFIDDTPENLEPAARLGLHTFLMKSPRQLSEILHSVKNM